MKKKQIYLFCVIALMGIQLLPWGSLTHKILIDQSIFKSIPFGIDVDNWLKIFNMDKGFFYKYFDFNNEQNDLLQIIEQGVVLEDDKVSDLSWRRSDNHFHNPLKLFYEAGLNDLASGESMPVWAQNGLGQNPFPQKDQSWKRIREFYYNALTANNYSDRITNLGRMFKGIGHQIHFIQDSAVPDHVRNDSHVLNGILGDYIDWTKKIAGSFRCIEGWADWNANLIYSFSDNPIFPAIHFNHILYSTAIPISNLIDSNYYDGTNPSISMEQGLAEYTNANFVSEDTICTNSLSPDHKHYFPFPKFSSTDLDMVMAGEKAPEYITAFDNKQDYVRYVRKEHDGVIINHFLKLGYFSTANPLIFERSLFIDDLCHKDFASILVPRAVGYSAALINYFYRGEIEVTLPANDGIYSFCFVPDDGFKKISLMVKNITPNNEEMKNGQVSVVLSYRFGSSTPFVPNPPIPDEERHYKIYRCPDVIEIPRENPLRLDVDMSGNPLPVNAVDVSLTIVFKGDLGSELTDAVAIGFKDISEPTAIDLYNNTDKVCFNGSYVNYDDTALWAAVDVNPQNGKIDCLNNAEIDITRKRIGQQSKGVFVYFSFNGSQATESNYFFKYDDGWEILPGVTPYRFFVLTDAYPKEFKYSIAVHSISIDNDECRFFYYPTSVLMSIPYVNKIEWVGSPGYYRHTYTPFSYSFGFLHHNLYYYDNYSVPESSNCSVPSSGSTLLSAESKRSVALGLPEIHKELPKKRLE